MKNDKDAWHFLSILAQRADRPLCMGTQAEQRPSAGELPPGAHVHDNWEVKMVVRGALHCPLDDGRQRVRAPAMVVVPPQRIHAATRPEDWRPGLVIIVLNGDSDQLTLSAFSRAHHLAGQARSRLPLTPPVLQAWQKNLGSPWPDFLARLVRDDRRTVEPFASMYRRAALHYLCAGLCLAHEEACRASPSPAAGLVERAEDLMRGAHFDPTLSVEQIAQALGRSPNYLAALFRQERGCTARQTLVRLRLARAHELLQRGRYSVKEVARLTGWSSPQYFANCFRCAFGYTPSEVDASSTGEA